jgi:hypothetical protein
MMIVTQKGTIVHNIEPIPVKWAGDGYYEEQKMKMRSVPPDTTLCVRRGTKSIKISEYPKTGKTIFRKRIVLSTSRGTATRIL